MRRSARPAIDAAVWTATHFFFVDSHPRDVGVVRMLTHARFLQLWWDDDDVHARKHAMHVFKRPGAG